MTKHPMPQQNDPRAIELPHTVAAMHDPPDCSWRAGEDVAQRAKTPPTMCVCLSPRIVAHPHQEVTTPVRGTMIPLAHCSVCHWRNEEIPATTYRKLMQSRWKRSARRPRLKTRFWNLANEIVATTVRWWQRHKHPVVTRAVYRRRLRVCQGCESCQPPEVPRECSECGCIVSLAANLKSKSCPLAQWPGEPQEKRGEEIANRTSEEADRLRREFADETVNSAGDAEPDPGSAGGT